MSDGSEVIRKMELVGEVGGGNGEEMELVERGRFRVREEEDGRGVEMLNELEIVEGELWANIYHSNLVVVVDLEKEGVVKRWIDFGGLVERVRSGWGGREVDVLNGIAWEEGSGRLFVTGKLWPVLYEVEVEKRARKMHVGEVEPFFFDPVRLKALRDMIA